MKKNILIICEFFYPINKIASVRITKFAKYLSELGFKVQVVARDVELFPIAEESDTKWIDNVKVFRVKENPHISVLAKRKRQFTVGRKQHRSLSAQSKSKEISTLKDLLKKHVPRYRAIFVNKFLNFGYITRAKKILKELGDIDVVISSYGPKSSLILGRWFKRKYPNTFWVSDFRDPVYSHTFTLFPFKNYSKNLASRYCKKANLITGVSQGCLDNLFLDNSFKTEVLTNGFDREDIQDLKYKRNSKFTFSYLGSLYSGRRDLTPLFKVLRDLINEGLIEREDIAIQYAGFSKEIFLNQVASYELEDIVETFDIIPRLESLKMQLESHVLLLASWNTHEEQGVVTGKFLEQMMIERPIVALVSGNLAGSKIREMMKEGNLGFCYEEATKNTDEELLKEYIKKQYLLYKNGKELDFNPDRKYIEQFDYQQISKRLITLIFPPSLT